METIISDAEDEVEEVKREAGINSGVKRKSEGKAKEVKEREKRRRRPSMMEQYMEAKEKEKEDQDREEWDVMLIDATSRCHSRMPLNELDVGEKKKKKDRTVA